MIRQAMIMAAGLGTRLRPFTDEVAKPFLPLLGVPLIQYSADLAASLGIRELVVNLHHLASDSRKRLNHLDLESGTKVKVSDESQLLLGSAGGLRQALLHLRDEPFLWLNGDVVLGFDLQGLVEKHRQARQEFGAVMTLALHPGNGLNGQYREFFWDQVSGRVSGFSDTPIQGRPFFCGAAILEPEALSSLEAGLPADFVQDVLRAEVARGRVAAHLVNPKLSGSWWDIGSPELWLKSHIELSELLEKGELLERIQNRIQKVAPQDRPSVSIAKNSVVYPGASSLSGSGISYGKAWVEFP
jgi:NDP-sugar pyrophosphorylase family protein